VTLVLMTIAACLVMGGRGRMTSNQVKVLHPKLFSIDRFNVDHQSEELQATTSVADEPPNARNPPSATGPFRGE
jgi:hypothetical protein